jgi:hypothetical protein
MRLFLIIGLLLIGCSREPDCDVASEKETPSPDGRYVATVFDVTCYNTTGDTPHAHLRRAGQKRSNHGNLLVGAPTDSFKATWTSTNALLIEYRSSVAYIDTPPATTNFDGVTATFRRLPNDGQ